ncbi:MAG TPA: hypothetical protein PLZ57_00165 [Pseudobdellovibrionaceae bacterium]|nr:hypothetical protein [Pseudobdellovibrionaceae bacterium]
MPCFAKFRLAALGLVFLGLIAANLANLRFFPFVPYGMFTRQIDADQAGALIPIVMFEDGQQLAWLKPRQLAPYRLAYQDPQLWRWIEEGSSDHVLARMKHWAATAEREQGRKVQSLKLLKVSGLVDAHGELRIEVEDLLARGELVMSWSSP